ncbi:hypothetical protein yc1106_00308 [Curvularia clavata]|uniref:Small nuclear ribonucleoprotein Prp3 C-terminal domain-containing protein n=1 Tax=Curvularia clavata TaxID=95742 RepID=A0A9Q8YZR9_CURCL|nr:hypothetical protein yc1106_00308 [Curvularia clavata]
MSPPWHLLPPDLIELQLGQLDLLLAMYPSELNLSPSSSEALSSLRDTTSTTQIPSFIKDSPSISALLDLPIDVSDQSSDPKTLRLELSVPFAYQGEAVPEDPPSVKVRVQQPSWMSKADTAQLSSCIPADCEDLLGTIDLLRENATSFLSSQALSPVKDSNKSAGSEPLVRVWFYFPSISTRSKRDDIVVSAPSYSLTGFLYAGKPGLLCLEGVSQSIDEYMRFIKTESWGDIPAHHKKCGGKEGAEGE